MTATDADNDEGLTDEKPFSPLYPVLNFGYASTNLGNSLPAGAAPPPYNFANNSNNHRSDSRRKEKLLGLMN